MTKRCLYLLKISLFFLVFFLTSCTQPPKKPIEPIKPIRYTEGKILEPQPRGAPDPRLPLNPAKTPKQYNEMFSMEYADVFDIDPRKGKDFSIELAEPSLIFIKVYSYGDEKGGLSAELYQEGREQPVWTTEAIMLQESVGFISDQVEITGDMVVAGTSWTIKLLNSADQAVSTEVWIGTVDQIMKPE